MKLNFSITAFALLVALSACSLNKKAFKNSRNVAIISINSSDEVTNNSSLQARIITDTRLTKDTVLVEPAEKIQTALYTLNRVLLSKLVSEHEIISSSKFKRYKDYVDEEGRSDVEKLMFLGVDFVAVNGYPVIKTYDKENIVQAFEYLPNTVDAVLVVSNYFQFQQDMQVSVGGLSSAGMGAQRVFANITVHMVNRAGKRIMSRSFIGQSAGKLSSKNNRYSLDELADQAVDDAFLKMNKWLVKILGK